MHLTKLAKAFEIVMTVIKDQNEAIVALQCQIENQQLGISRIPGKFVHLRSSIKSDVLT